MAGWQSFEQQCCDYLNRAYGSERVRFICDGGSDSTSPDIIVIIDGVNKFNIEVKSPQAQSGQFVVLNENGELIFSPRNRSNIEDALPFLTYMNANYDRYATATTSGVDLEMDPDEYNEWIINHYLEKNERFVITKDAYSFIIFPTQRYGEYFDTECTYRIKKSGSNEVPKSIANSVSELFGGVTYRYELGKKLCVISSKRYTKGTKLTLGDYDYMVSAVLDDGALYIRRLSNTNNANVIFSISLKKRQDARDLEIFEKRLQGE